MSVKETMVNEKTPFQACIDDISLRIGQLLGELEHDYMTLWAENVKLKNELAERPAICQEVEPEIWVHESEPEWHLISPGHWTMDLTDFHAAIVRDLGGHENPDLELEEATKLDGEIVDNMLIVWIKEK